MSYFSFPNYNNQFKVNTYSVLAGYLFDHRRDNKAGRGTDCIHDAIKESGKVRREILIVRQIRDKSSTVETQREE